MKIQYRLMEELKFDGELIPVLLQDNEIVSEDKDEVDIMRIELQPDYDNRLIVVKETQESV